MNNKTNAATSPSGFPKRGWVAAVIIVAILIVDQAMKIWVKTHMALQDDIEIFSWFHIHFIENNGMAYGMSFMPKTVLTLFRIAAVVLLCYYLNRQVAKRARWGYIVCLAMIIAGATGNIIDCMFYGMVFTGSTFIGPSVFVPWGEGYGEFLQGKVVDMLDFPIWHTVLPDWFPFNGGQPYTFFSAIFNFADACITSGVILVLLFFRRELGESLENANKSDDTSTEQTNGQAEDVSTPNA